MCLHRCHARAETAQIFFSFNFFDFILTVVVVIVVIIFIISWNSHYHNLSSRTHTHTQQQYPSGEGLTLIPLWPSTFNSSGSRWRTRTITLKHHLEEHRQHQNPVGSRDVHSSKFLVRLIGVDFPTRNKIIVVIISPISPKFGGEGTTSQPNYRRKASWSAVNLLPASLFNRWYNFLCFCCVVFFFLGKMLTC